MAAKPKLTTKVSENDRVRFAKASESAAKAKGKYLRTGTN
jgi:hypothetical protein